MYQHSNPNGGLKWTSKLLKNSHHFLISKMKIIFMPIIFFVLRPITLNIFFHVLIRSIRMHISIVRRVQNSHITSCKNNHILIKSILF